MRMPRTHHPLFSQPSFHPPVSILHCPPLVPTLSCSYGTCITALTLYHAVHSFLLIFLSVSLFPPRRSVGAKVDRPRSPRTLLSDPGSNITSAHPVDDIRSPYPRIYSGRAATPNLHSLADGTLLLAAKDSSLTKQLSIASTFLQRTASCRVLPFPSEHRRAAPRLPTIR